MFGKIFGGKSGGRKNQKLTANKDYTMRIAACELRNREKTFEACRSLGFGEVTRWTADQETRRLELSFADGASLVASFEIIASFNPEDRSLLLACDNSSVAPELSVTAAAMKAYGVKIGAAELKGKSNLAFVDVARVIALAHDFGDFITLFRGIDAEHRSFFLGLVAMSCHDAAGVPISPEQFMGAQDAIDEAAAINLVRAYFAAMDPIEKDWKKSRGAGGLEAAIARKDAVYDHFWTRSDNYWRPSAMGGDEFDPQKIVEWRAFPKRGGGVYVLPYRAGAAGNEPFVVREVGGALRITDCDLDWGRNTLWT